MEKTELMELGEKICLILSKQGKIGDRLNCSYQGGGKALFLKIVASHGDEKFLRAAKKFLTGELSLRLKYEKKHGKGGKSNTLLVQLFGIKDESLEKIKSMSYGIVPVEKIIQSHEKQVESSEKEEVAEQTPSTPVVAHKRTMADTSKYRLSLSRYLRPIMEMEEITPDQFRFDKDIKDETIVVHCQNEEIAKMIEKAIVYTASFTSRSVVEREGSLVVVDGTRFYDLKHKPFAFPPKEGQSLELVRKKVKMIFTSKLEVYWNGDGEKFVLTFSRKTVVSKALKILKDLEWKITTFNDSIMVWYGYSEQKESDTISSIPDSAPIAPVISNVPSSDEAILEELKSMLADGNLSPETMERIEKALLDDFKKSNPEEYAKTLLAKLGY